MSGGECAYSPSPPLYHTFSGVVTVSAVYTENVFLSYCGYSLVVERGLAMAKTGVRFSLPAPTSLS